MVSKRSTYDLDEYDDELELLEGVRLDTKYQKFKSRDRKVNKRRELEGGDWYD